MNRKVRTFVCATVLAALASLYLVVRTGGVIDSAAIRATICFVVIAIMADALQYRLASATVGTIAFIPFLALICLAPSWLATASVATVILVGALYTRQNAIKATFNVAQYTIAAAVSTWCYLKLGGQSLLAQPTPNWWAYGGMFISFFAINQIFVSTVLSLSQNKSIGQTWRENTRLALLYDVMSLPFAFIFATVYVHFGAIGVAGLAIPLLGARQLYKINWQLENTNQELLQLMVAAIEARDPYTSGHSRRVSHNAKIIARAMGLPTRDVDRVGVAALLHDVGKIHEVFAPILRKPGRLTPDERLTMETHPIKSAELVQNVSHLSDLVTPIRHHHENWDGTGYPEGLRAEAIPLWSRIIMFADTIDAMTTDRPYRAALTETDVRSELLRFRGQQFDPEICDLLLASPLYPSLFMSDRPASRSPTRVTALRRTDPKQRARVSAGA